MRYNYNYISNELKQIIDPATKESHRFEKPLSVKEYPQGFIVPFVGWEYSIGGILDKDGNIIKDSECYEWKEKAPHITDDFAIEDKSVVYLGFLLTVWGHAFTDNLRKIWILDSPTLNALLKNYNVELVYTTSWNRPLPESIVSAFQIAGVDITKARQITKVTKFKTIFVPDNCYAATTKGRIYCDQYADIINRIKKRIIKGEDSLPSKVYFTRTKLNSPKEYGEVFVEKVFKDLGYTIISPEEYSLLEQLQIIQHCSHFAATEGSVAHLTLFCNPNTEVCIINKANYLNFHQVMINEFADLSVTYVQANHSTKANKDYPWWGPFYLCMNKYLRRYSHSFLLYRPFWMRYSYWKYSENILYKCYSHIRNIIK